MSNTVVTINGVASSTISELIVTRVRRQLVGARRDQFVEVPGRPGSWVFAEEPGDGRIIIEFELQGATFAARRTAVRAVAAWADTLNGPVALIVDDESDRYHSVVLVSAVDVDEWLNEGTGELEYRTAPYALANAVSTQSITANPSPDSDTFAIADTLVAYPVIELTPTDGTITSFDLTLNGDTLSWAGLIADDATLTISSISDTVTAGANTDTNLTGAYSPASLSMRDLSGEFPLLVPGSNAWSLTWAGTAAHVTILITWRRRYR